MKDNFDCFDEIGLKEPNTNHLASQYISEHYSYIVAQVRKMNVAADKAEDLVHDVFLSIYNSEENGEGYDSNHGNGENMITVNEFVFGRIRGYAKNDKYHNVYSERRNVSHAADCVEVISASTNGEEYENMDSFQKAYANATTYNDDIESVELRVSLRQNIEVCCGFNGVIGFDMLNLFKNMEMFNSNFNSSLFDQLRISIRQNSELGEAFRSVMEAAIANRGDFEFVISTM